MEKKGETEIKIKPKKKKHIFNKANDSEYYLTDSLKGAFDVDGELAEVTSVDQFWKYLNDRMTGAFYGSEVMEHEEQQGGKDNSNDVKDGDGKAEDKPLKLSLAEQIQGRWKNTFITNKPLYILKENLVLGVPRIRQVKVTNNSCEIHGYFRRLFVDCFNMFSTESEDREKFGLQKSPAWTFSTAAETGSVKYWGTLTTYSGGGFYSDLSLTYSETIALLKELKDNLWITRGSRAVFVDFSIYNANLNVYCICKLIFEFLPPGGVTPSFRFTTATLNHHSNNWQWTLRILLYIFSVYVLYCLCEEIREMIYFKGEYFIQFWNYIDITVILLTCLLVIGTEYMNSVIELYIEDIHMHPDRYGNLETPRFIYQVVQISGAILLFFIYLRTFKYLNFNRRMAQLNNTIRNCSKDILGFSVMFFVAYFAYAELGYLVFGNEVMDFRSFGQSMFTLLRTILGDFDYDDIHKANWIVAPIYFLSYIILVFFILLNMFLAIINDTYADVKTDIAIAPKEMEMSEYIAKLYRNMLRKLGCRVKQENERQTFFNTTINEIRDALVKCDYEDREIEMYFTRYDIDPLKDLKKQDVEKLYKLFAQEDASRKTGEQTIVTWKDFQRQDDKLVELENSIVMLGQKVQELVRGLESFQGTSVKTLQ